MPVTTSDVDLFDIDLRVTFGVEQWEQAEQAEAFCCADCG